MSLIKWAVGFLVFQIAIVVLLIGIAPFFGDATYIDEGISQADFNSSSTVSTSDLGIFDRFMYSVSNIPFPFNVLTFIPSIIGVIIGLAYLRGVE